MDRTTNKEVLQRQGKELELVFTIKLRNQEAVHVVHGENSKLSNKVKTFDLLMLK